MSSFLDYLFYNYFDYIHTPLRDVLLNFIVSAWTSKYNIMKQLSEIKIKKLIQSFYVDKENSISINESRFSLVIKNIFDKSDNLENLNIETNYENNNFNKKLLQKIENFVFKIDLKNEFDLIENEIAQILKKVDGNKNLPSCIIKILFDYQTDILKKMSKIEKYVECEKINFLHNFKEYMYFDKNESEINKYFENKINKFIRILHINKEDIKYKKKIIQNLNNKILNLKIIDKKSFVEKFLSYSFDLSEFSLIKIIFEYVNENIKQKFIKKLSSGCSKKIKNLINDDVIKEKCFDIECQTCYFRDLINYH